MFLKKNMLSKSMLKNYLYSIKLCEKKLLKITAYEN